MLKIFVTGDNHIGLKYANYDQSALLASNRLTAFEGMVQSANREDCSLFVITGDLFENTYGVSKREIKSLLDMLSRFKGRVIVLPGNHDYYDKDVKVWQYFKDVMGDYDNVMLLTDYRPYELDVNGQRVILYPALCTTLHSAPGQNNIGWIKDTQIENGDAFHIGIAHGAVEGETIDTDKQYFMMKRSELEAIPVDLWLIGHTHVPFPANLTEEYTYGEKIFNPGTHVQTHFSCNAEGSCFIVEIDDAKNTKAKKINSGNMRFYRREITVTAGEMENILNRELADLEDNSVVEIILKGAVSAVEYESKNRITDSVLSRFIEGICTDYELNRLISKELIDKEFPETSFSAGLLTSLLDDPKEAQLAYELLKSIKGEK